MQANYSGPACLGQCTSHPHCGCNWTLGPSTPELGLLSHYLLASGSHYRADLLKRLNRPFQQVSPDVDESQHLNEAPTTLASRLAKTKANASAIREFIATAPNHSIIIASDQVAALGDQILGKPGTLERARQQLASMQGQSVSFHTSLYMRNLADDTHFSALDTTVAKLRMLSSGEIERYLDADNPLDCAGSFKVESLGISLFSSVETSDPTALVGLPMIALCEGLRQFGLEVP
ncbi:MAG: septum formation protein [Granulosicoccus sp.]|jgi:septum formation protein